MANNANTVKKKTSSTPTDTSLYSPKGLPVHPAPIPEFNFVSETNEPISEEKEEDLPILQPGDMLLITTPNLERMKCNTPEFERKSTFDKIKDNVKTKGKDIIQLIYNPNEPDDEYQQMCPAEDGQKQKTENTAMSIDELDGSAKLWIGKDYTNFIVKDFSNLESPYIDLVDRNTTPRMPWHDIGVFIDGKAARDVARHFIQRWNSCKLKKARVNPSYPYLIPKSYNSPFPQLNNLQTHLITCQVLRSASCWSVGFLDTEAVEQSIHEAYIDTIRRAQHYIYIENQFFVTLSACSNLVYNQIGDALFERITRAHR